MSLSGESLQIRYSPLLSLTTNFSLLGHTISHLKTVNESFQKRLFDFDKISDENGIILSLLKKQQLSHREKSGESEEVKLRTRLEQVIIAYLI